MKLNSALLVCTWILLSVLPATSQEVDREDILRKVNEIREEGCTCAGKKMPPAQVLNWNKNLEQSAFLHARDMVERDYFSHVSPAGKNPGDRVKSAGYEWAYVGENIASGQKNFDEVLQRWINSPVHCKILMNPNFDEMAVARYKDTWVQHFGKHQQ